jgi:hypothetical protein
MRPEVSILASLHLGFVLLSVLPGESLFLERYHSLTNTLQKWRMFYSAYTYRSQEFTVKADNGVTFRPVPPRYLENDGRKLTVRIVNYLGRLANPGNETARRVWIESLAGEVEKSGGRSYVVEERSLRIRNFHYSRRDGVLFKEMGEVLGPFPVGK